MPYERKVIDIGAIQAQQDICNQIFDKVTADGQPVPRRYPGC